MTEEVPDRNALARQLADARDELTSLRKELEDAWETAAKWSQWVESLANKKAGLVSEVTVVEGTDEYDTMLSEANLLVEKFKDHWYDIGYATALRELRSHMSDAIADWAEKQGVDIRG